MHYYLHKRIRSSLKVHQSEGTAEGTGRHRGPQTPRGAFKDWGRARGTPGSCGIKGLVESRRAQAVGAVSPGTLSRQRLKHRSKTSF